MDSLFSVKDKNIVITGGAGVLGSSLALDLAKAGARICISDMNLQGANNLCKEIKDNGGFAFAVETNVLDKKSVESTGTSAIEKLGKVDILINAAGGNKKEATTGDDLSFFDMPADAVQWVFNLNLMGTILPCQVFGKYMAQQKSGIILNVSSMSAFCALTKVGAYSAAKAGVSNFTQWLSVHMCQNYSTDIRVNAIAPGFFLTKQNEFLLTDKETGKLTARGKTIVDHTPMQRFGQPEELTGTVIWLLSDASKFVTGTVIPIDGGFNAFSGV